MVPTLTRETKGSEQLFTVALQTRESGGLDVSNWPGAADYHRDQRCPKATFDLMVLVATSLLAVIVGNSPAAQHSRTGWLAGQVLLEWVA